MLMAEQHSIAMAEELWGGDGFAAQRVDPRSRKTYSVQRAARRKTKSKALLTIALFLIGFVGINLYVQVMVIQRDYNIRQLQHKMADLKREMVATRMEMASLESFDRIQAIAENKLGMKVADSNDYQCIAAVPERQNQPLQTYAKQSEPLDKNDLWNQITTWVGNAGRAMAQNQQ